MYEFPERKKYIYTIPTTKGKLELRFEQATAQETKDFYKTIQTISEWGFEQKIDAIVELNRYYYDFIKNKTNIRRYNIRKRKVLSLVKNELASYVDQLLTLLHPTRKSIYTDTNMPKINWKNARQWLFPNEKEAIYKKTGISTDIIYDKLTMEQVGWYLDKIVFENYEMFKEWKAINDRLSSKWWLSDTDKELLEFIKSQKKYGN